MSERDELALTLRQKFYGWMGPAVSYDIADATLAAGYRKPRVIRSAAELEALPFGSAVQTSDLEDVVVLKSEGRNFLNQSGCELSVEVLWRHGTRPFTVLYEGTTP